MKSASKVNLQKVILDSIGEAADFVCHSSGVNIREMPEYYINVAIAHKLISAFPTLGFRLEMPVKDLLGSYGVKNYQKSEELRCGGKFDIVLHTKKNRKIRHVIEVKRTLNKQQLKKEALRISALAHECHESKRLETGYIVAIRRLKDTIKNKTVDDLIKDRVEWITSVTNKSMVITARYDYYESGELGFDSDERLVIVVFCLKKYQ